MSVPLPVSWATRLLLLAIPSLAVAQAQPVARASEINLSASVTVQRAPDFANLRLAITHAASKAADAARPNAAAARSVIAALTAAGVPAESVVTAGYSVGPQYAPDRRRVVGYAARTVLLVRSTDIERLGELIDEALSAGATEIEGITFSLRRIDDARHEALTNAVTQLRQDADVMAAAAGGHVGALLRLNMLASHLEQPANDRRLNLAAGQIDAGAVPPINPGEIAVTVAVTAQFEFLPGPGR
jgi:uncharacterized protein YggE